MALADLSPQELERVVRTIEEISVNIEKVVRVVTAFAQQQKINLDDGQKRLKKIDDGMVSLEDRTKKLHRAQTTMWDSFKLQAQQAEASLASMYRAAGTGVGSLFGAVGTLTQQVLSGPLGTTGLIGLMFKGLGQQEMFRSTAAQIGYTLQAVGGVGKRELGEINAQVHSLYRGWGSMGQELQGTLEAFAQFSIGAEAFEKTNIHARGFMQNIAGIATAMDKLGAAAAGTTGKLIGDIMMSASVSAGEAQNQLIGLSASLRAAGLNYTQFAGGIVQANSALRMQNQSLSETTQIFNGIRKHLMDLGIGPQKAAAMAMERLQGGAQALGSLSPGMAGYIGQKLAAQGNQNFTGLTDPVAIMMRMRAGVEQGGQSSFTGPAFRAIVDTIKDSLGVKGDTAQDKLITAYGVEKTLGITPAQAMGLVEGADASKLLIDPAKETAGYLKDMKGTFERFASAQDQFKMTMLRVQDTMARFGVHLFTAVVTGVATIAAILRNIPLEIKSWIKPFGLSKEEDAQMRLTRSFITRLSQRSETSFTGMGGALQSVFAEIGGGGAAGVIGGSLGPVLGDIKKYRQLTKSTQKHYSGPTPLEEAEAAYAATGQKLTQLQKAHESTTSERFAALTQRYAEEAKKILALRDDPNAEYRNSPVPEGSTVR